MQTNQILNKHYKTIMCVMNIHLEKDASKRHSGFKWEHAGFSTDCFKMIRHHHLPPPLKLPRCASSKQVMVKQNPLHSVRLFPLVYLRIHTLQKEKKKALCVSVAEDLLPVSVKTRTHLV